MDKKVEIIIDENGEITFETSNFSGQGCLKETEWIKDILGEEKPETRKMKPEYYKKEINKTKRTLNQ